MDELDGVDVPVLVVQGERIPSVVRHPPPAARSCCCPETTRSRQTPPRCNAPWGSGYNGDHDLCVTGDMTCRG